MGSFASPHYNGNALASVSTIKGSAGQLTMLDAKNENVLGSWIQIFDHASPTVGTTVPTLSFWVPPGGGVDKMFQIPVEFQNAIKYACTTTKDGSVAPVTGLIINASSM